jgi:hypothetical protein
VELYFATYSRYRCLDHTNKETIVFAADVFVFVFEKAIPYSQPRIETFGRNFPHYNWVEQTHRVAILTVNGNIDMPFFEVYFPKP